jgi:tRNA(fMet)-specific endonuclease VapC
MVSRRYLLDTNVLSEPLRPRPRQRIIERLHENRSSTTTGAPVLHEMAFGYLVLPPSRRRRAIEEYLVQAVRNVMPILPYDQGAAEWHAAERARLTALGLTPPHFDGQIAAIAAVNGLVLVTVNTADFQHFQGLEVEDWSA